MFFFTASKLQFRHRVEGLRTHRFWLARARLVVAFGLFGSVASSFGTMWKGCERTVFGCLFSGLCFACLGHEACCRSRLSEASHRGILLGVGSNPVAVRAFRMGSFTAPWHVCGRLAWALLSAPPRHLALAAVRGFRKLRIGAFCLAWARILLLFGRFAWAPSRRHGTSADGLAWALLSAPPRHLALRYTGFGPSLAARVLATRNVLWIPKVTGSIFSGLCFWLA